MYMGGIQERRARQQEAIDNGEPLRTQSGRKKKGEEKGLRPNSAQHIGVRVGRGIINPSPALARGSRRMFGAGDRDSATVERTTGYIYDGLTLGVAPVARLISDEVRSREGKKRKQQKKKEKERKALKEAIRTKKIEPIRNKKK